MTWIEEVALDEIFLVNIGLFLPTQVKLGLPLLPGRKSFSKKHANLDERKVSFTHLFVES